MPSARWLSSRLTPTLLSAVRFLAPTGRSLLVILRSLSPRAVLMLTGLALIAAGTWAISREATLVLLGLLIIRDAERPEPTPDRR